ncbi:hypothetical protein KKB10_01145 [Patescibacteria group bacterium]|nr:hypothetical protein [Patescibacteria group bacterium]MBU1951812.1 hypothetical protein [Patescibacteria group bacterium]
MNKYEPSEPNNDIGSDGNENVREFPSADEIPVDPKAEGLRPHGRYAGGDPNEIIVIAGVGYRKRIASEKNLGPRDDRVIPETERDYYQHPGPGWDFRNGYLRAGWGITDMDADHLSDLPLYELVEIPGQRRLVLAPNGDPGDVLKVIGKIEGEDWLIRQRKFLNDDESIKGEPDHLTIKGAIRAVQQFHEELAALRKELVEADEEDRAELEEEIAAYEGGRGPKVIVYGAGGQNRYFVLSNGEIVVSEAHMGMKAHDTKKQAGELGIRIF